MKPGSQKLSTFAGCSLPLLLIILAWLWATPVLAQSVTLSTGYSPTVKTATLTISGHTAAWWHKSDQTNATCASVAANSSSADLTNLTGGTTYVWKAYSDSSCSTELASTTFTTIAVTIDQVTATTARLNLNHNTHRTWSYKQTSPTSSPAQACQQDWLWAFNPEDSPQSLTGLSPSSSYTFTVYWGAGCAAGKEAEAVAFTTSAATLAVSSITTTTATLTISDHSNIAWWYQGNQSGATCTSVAANTLTANLADLTVGTEYTYKAYRASGCAAANEIASRTFTTLAGPPSAPSNLSSTKSWRPASLPPNPVQYPSGIRVRFSWTSGADNGATITGTDLRYRRTSPVGSWQIQRNAHITEATLTFVSTITNFGKAMEFQVKDDNSKGAGTWSASSAFTVALEPAKPTAPSITPGHKQLGLSWTAPDSRGADITGYEVQYRLGSSGDWTDHTHSGTGTTATITGLNIATAYQVWFRATNSEGDGAWSDAASATTLDRPGEVAGLTATAGSDGSIDLDWTAISEAASYKAQYKYGTQDWSATRQSTATTNSLNIARSLLTANTAHSFRVAATNGSGDGPWSDEVVATPVDVTLQASTVGADSATLTIGNYSGTWYYKQSAPTAGTCSSGVSTASTTLSSLSTGQIHTFKAYKDSQCTGAVLATAPPFLTKPGKAAGVTATAAAAALDLSWTATTGASGYKVQWKSGSDDWSATSRQTTSTTASATIPSLTNGTIYTVRVAAVNDVGDGVWSDTATGTPSGSVLRLAAGTSTGGAVINISGHAGTWYSKATPPTDATCETNSTSTKSVTGKSSGTSYTITAYSDSNCATQLTSLGFTTLPAKVTGVTVVARAASLGVSWTAETGNAATSYKVQWKSGAQGYAANRQVITTKTRASLTGLTNATQYTIRVAATNAGGPGSWSDNATGTPSATAVTLTASVTASGGSFTLANHAGNWWYKITPPATATCSQGPSSKTLVSSTLSSGTEYTLAAYSDSSCATKLTLLDFLTLPAKTTGVTLANQGASLRASWTAVTGASGYKVQWKSGNENFGTTRQTTSATTSATIPSLTNGTAYSMRVAAVNAAGDGAWSDTATATPSVKLIASKVTATGARLTLAGHTGSWYVAGYRGNTTVIACSRVDGSWKDVTLQGNRSYYYAAFSSSRCEEPVLADTSFTTPGAIKLLADNVTKSSVELYLYGYNKRAGDPDVWYSLRPASGRAVVGCGRWGRSQIIGVSPLGAGQTYTAEAFWDRNCSPEQRLSSVTFTALTDADGPRPSLAASNLTSTGATLTLSNHTGNWWYQKGVNGACTAVTGGATSVHVTGLTPNKDQVFWAWSQDECDQADESTEWYATAHFTTPGTVSVSVGDKTSTGFTLTLRGYTQANGYPDTWAFNVLRKASNGYWEGSLCRTLPRATDTAAVTGLEAGKQYTINIYNSPTCNFASTIVSATPVTMTSMAAGSVGPSSATLTLEHHEGAWSYKGGEASGQGAGASSSSGAGQCRSVPAGTYTAELDNLSAGTDYAYTAHFGGNCAGGEIAATSFTTPQSATPGAPDELAATAGNASIALTWNKPSDASITGYEYQVSRNDTNGGKLNVWSDWMAIGGAGADTVLHNVSGLINGHEYRFRLRAVNDAGTGTSAPVAAPYYVSAIPEADKRPSPPATPNSVSVALGDGVLKVAWSAVERATGYHITYSSDNGASWKLAAENHADKRIAISGVDNALTYIVGVRAVNEYGKSGWTNSSPVGPFSPGSPEKPVEVWVLCGDGTLKVFWSAVEGATDYHITYSSDHGANWHLAALNHPTKTIEIAGIDKALTYIVGVRARNRHGYGGWTNSRRAGPCSDDGAWTTGAGMGPSGAAVSPVPNLVPSFAGDVIVPDASSWKQNTPIEPVTLPRAQGGNGTPIYSLSPELPQGLSFDPATRLLSGTPAEALEETMYTYSAADADGDAAELTFAVRVAADLAPGFANAEPISLRLEQYNAMDPLTLPEARGGDGELHYELLGALPWGLAFDAATRTLSGTPMEVSAGASLKYRVVDSDAVAPDSHSLAIGVEVGVSAADAAALEGALAAQGRALLSGAAGVIGARLRGVDDGQGGEGLTEALSRALSQLGAGGVGGMIDVGIEFDGAYGPTAADDLTDKGVVMQSGSLGDGMPPTDMGGGASPGMPRNLSFALPFGGSGNPDAWMLWGASAEQGFDGGSGASDFDGRLSSVYLGADGRIGENLMVGAALSRGAGRTDYDTGTAGGAPGRLDTEILSVHPYIRGRLASGFELWALGGYGSGELKSERELEGASAETADLSMRMAAAGLRRSLKPRGRFELALVGGAGHLNLSTGSGQRAVDGLETDVSQLRLALEVSAGGALSPHIQVGTRADEVGGRTDTGLEVVGGLRHSGERLDFEALARWLSTGSDDGGGYEEYGGSLRLTLKALPDGTGLRFGLAPSWGRAGVAGGLLGGGRYDMFSAANQAFAMPGAGQRPAPSMALESDLGYGLATRHGLLVLGGGHRRDAFGAAERYGFTWESVGDADTGWNTRLRLDWHPATGTTEAGCAFELTWRREF